MAKKKKLKISKRTLAVAIVTFLVITSSLILGVKMGLKEEIKEETPNNEVEEQPIIGDRIVDIDLINKNITKINVDSNSRPIAVMVSNIKDARKVQSGLQDAYIVYEIIVEGGISRFMALFLDQNTERIGSIRSTRHYYLDYVLENDAILAHCGQSPQAQADFKTLGITRVAVNEGTTGWREKISGVAYVHRLATSISSIKKGFGSKRTTTENNLLLNYVSESINLEEVPNAIKANEVSISYSSSNVPKYKYDSKNKVYVRYYGSKPVKDYKTSKELTVKNIITYKVKNYTLNDPEKKGRQGLENIGKGTGYYISEGYAVPITWEKTSREAKTIYRFENGEELVVNEGNTFIQIQPEKESLKIS